MRRFREWLLYGNRPTLKNPRSGRMSRHAESAHDIISTLRLFEPDIENPGIQDS